MDVVTAAVLYGVQKLGYDQPTVDQSSILQDITFLQIPQMGRLGTVAIRLLNSKLEAT